MDSLSDIWNQRGCILYNVIRSLVLEKKKGLTDSGFVRKNGDL